jgi:peptidoglycan hydrolase-like protein with peptidoglycan-binding domain
MPAFKATNTPTPSADPGHSSTPLADLHNAKPPLPPAHAAEPAAIKAKANTPAAAAKARALSVFKSGLRAAAAAPTTSRAVADLQSILTARGIKVTRDGLYGPKTAAAWSKLAKSKGLPTTISRGGPKIAKVSTQTYEALSLPHIP